MAPTNELEKLERRLNEEVDDEFFVDPDKFRTLHRVIEVLGIQCHQQIDESGGGGGGRRNKSTSGSTTDLSTLHTTNPAYMALLKQRATVETAIEHMAINHCSDLNGSVVAVGKVARQYSDAMERVRSLRKQVQAIKLQLGSHAGANPNEADGKGGGDGSGAKKNECGSSLRELWLKKLECEAVLALLGKLEIIREAPSAFDALVEPRSGHCRIVAAVALLSTAINTMFSDDVAQIQAMSKIMEQLMLRKQRAEEIVWDAIHDVLYLRTANAIRVEGWDAASALTNDSDSCPSDDDQSVFSLSMAHTSQPGPVRVSKMIPKAVIEEELNLEEDEIRCLEDVSNTAPWDPSSPNHTQLPRYSDATLALRILIEALAKLGRLDDVERYLNESLLQELRKITEQQQAATYARLERTKTRGLRQQAPDRDSRVMPPPLECKKHFHNLLKAFGSVMLRLSHLAQTLRHRISSDPNLVTPSYSIPSSALHSVLTSTYSIMQHELKTFLRACLETDEFGPQHNTQYQSFDPNREASSKTGIFSLGIIDQPSTSSAKTGTSKQNRPPTSKNMDLPADLFVTNILFPRTNCSPQIRYALSFRRALERWTLDNDQLKKDLALCTNEDTSTPSYNLESEETALKYLDSVIKTKLLPVLQDTAVNSTVSALEREDAFEPDVDSNLYSRSITHQLTQAEICLACRALLDSTGPLFNALHRLPKDGEMYTPLVAVLDYALLTFISRVKQRVADICEEKTAQSLLGKGKDEKNKNGLSLAMERRKAYSLLLQEYGYTDDLQTTFRTQESAIQPLPTSASDTKPKHNDTPSFPSQHEPTQNDPDVEDNALEEEVTNLIPLLKFSEHDYGSKLNVCSDQELMQAACLAHSLIKFASLLEKRLKSRSGNWRRTATRGLREAIKNIKSHGLHMAKFCRIEMLVQISKRMSQICKSTALMAQDAVKLPSCVNSTGEYLAAASDNLRDAGGNAVCGYALSSLEQYIPLILMQSVRCIARGEGLPPNVTLSMNGIEAMDRAGSVLYRDLKGATSFEGSFWDDAAAADSFERSASFVAMMELSMEELETYYRNHPSDFTEADYKLMFMMNCPRRTGNVGRYNVMKGQMEKEEAAATAAVAPSQKEQ